MNNQKLVFVGGGNMAASLIGGLLEQGYQRANICACDPAEASRQRLEQLFNITTSPSNDQAADADVVVLAVKPQVMATVAAGLTAFLSHRPLIISIAAGIPVDALQHWLGNEVPIVRCMPNTPALLRKSASGLYATASVTQIQRQLAENIMGAVGIVCWLDAETDIDRVTALSGSGPAYFFLVLEAMENAGVKLGLNRDIARRLTIQTALGAASMAAEGSTEPAELRRQVTSPGGTTERAIETFMMGQLPLLFEQAMTAAFKRAVEMADEARSEGSSK